MRCLCVKPACCNVASSALAYENGVALVLGGLRGDVRPQHVLTPPDKGTVLRPSGEAHASAGLEHAKKLICAHGHLVLLVV